jgi:hypothetical protein
MPPKKTVKTPEQEQQDTEIREEGVQTPVTPVQASGPVGNSKSQQDYQRRIAETKAILAKEQKTMFIIPLVPPEKEGAYEIVNINGYQLTIKKGVMVEIPISIANILADHYRISMSAGSDKLLSRNEVKDGVSIDEALNG